MTQISQTTHYETFRNDRCSPMSGRLLNGIIVTMRGSSGVLTVYRGIENSQIPILELTAVDCETVTGSVQVPAGEILTICAAGIVSGDCLIVAIDESDEVRIVAESQTDCGCASFEQIVSIAGLNSLERCVPVTVLSDGITPTYIRHDTKLSIDPSLTVTQEPDLEFCCALADVEYLLHANFDANNQVYSDGQLIDLQSEGIQVGTITIRDDGGNTADLGIVSNELNFIRTSAGNFPNTCSWQQTDPLTRSIGLTALIKHRQSISTFTTYGFGTGASALASLVPGLDLTVDSGAILTVDFRVTGAPVQDVVLSQGVIDVTQNIEYCLILGGYNSSGLPYMAGNVKTDFDFGASLFIKTVNGQNWRLFYRRIDDNTTAIKLGAHGGSTGAGPIVIDDVRIPDADTSNLLEPTFLNTTVSASNVLTYTADAVNEIKLSALPASGEIEVRFRNDWAITVDSTGNVDLVEDADGSPTVRATVTGATATSRIVWIADDAEIKLNRDDGAIQTYSSASANKTLTNGVVQSLGTGGAIAHIASWPRGNDSQYSELDIY